MSKANRKGMYDMLIAAHRYNDISDPLLKEFGVPKEMVVNELKEVRLDNKPKRSKK